MKKQFDAIEDDPATHKELVEDRYPSFVLNGRVFLPGSYFNSTLPHRQIFGGELTRGGIGKILDAEGKDASVDITKRQLCDCYFDPKMNMLFRECGLQYRDLASVFDEVKTARVGDPVERAKLLEADDFFEGILKIKQKVHPLDIRFLQTSMTSITRRLGQIEHDVFQSFAGLQKVRKYMDHMVSMC
jgi:hypothetical protein